MTYLAFTLFPNLLGAVAKYVPEHVVNMAVSALVDTITYNFGVPAWAVEATLRYLGII